MVAQVTLGNKQVAPIGLGTWHMGDERFMETTEIEALQYGLSLGATVIDTAEMYGAGRSEKLIGKALSGVNREDVFLISKFYPYHAKKPQLQQALENSLQRLKVDYLDLYMLHWRGNTPLRETVRDLEDMKRQGLIKDWGVSNFDGDDMRELLQLPNGENCAANEDLYNLSSRGIEYDLIPLQKELNMPLIAYAPIAQGDSLGADLLDQPQVQIVVERHDASIFQIMLAWSIRNGQTIAIPQSSSKEHIRENILASKICLTPNDIILLNEAFPVPTRKMPLDVI